MSVKIDIKVKTNLKAIQHFLDKYPDNVGALVQQSYDDTLVPVVNALRTPPRKRSYPSDYPLEWTSERQRRAYFATNGFGAGIPYRRTGGLTRAWRGAVIPRGDGFRVVILNPVKSARFVYGTLSFNPSLRTAGQQRFHVITGWVDGSKNPVYAGLEDFREDFKRRLQDAVKEFGVVR